MPHELDVLQRQRIQRTVRGATSEGDGGPGELNVVPFLDILLNVLMFVLATIAVTFTTTLDAAPPRTSPRPPGAAALGLNVVVVDAGFVVSARGQRVGAGCEAPGSGLAVGRAADGERDYEGLRDCARRLKAATADAEGDVTLTASNDVPYAALVRTMDALRGAPDEALFDHVSFGVPR